MGWGPEAPDMTAANTAASSAARISEDQWGYYQKEIAPRALQQMDDQIQIGRDTYDMAKEGQDFQLGLAKKYDDRYWNTVAPMEDSIFADANSFDSGEWRGQQAGLARGDIAQAYSNARDSTARSLSRTGVNPSSGMAIASDRKLASDEALATVGALNKVNLAADSLGWSRKLDAAALGKGLAGFSSNATSAAQGWGSQGLNASGLGMSGISAGSGLGTSAASGAAGGLNTASSNYRANAIESAKTPGFDALMGLASGGMKLAGSWK